MDFLDLLGQRLGEKKEAEREKSFSASGRLQLV
jgi:hypothetical protein